MLIIRPAFLITSGPYRAWLFSHTFSRSMCKPINSAKLCCPIILWVCIYIWEIVFVGRHSVLISEVVRITLNLLCYGDPSPNTMLHESNLENFSFFWIPTWRQSKVPQWARLAHILLFEVFFSVILVNLWHLLELLDSISIRVWYYWS